MNQINVMRPYLPPIEEYYDKLKIIWNDHSLSNMGPLHNEFEKKVKDIMETSECVLLNNGHMSLELVLEAMELQGEVITTPYTFASTTNAIVRKGLIPVFCDIHEDDYTIDETKIESLINQQTCAIMPVHVYGNLCNMEAIWDIAQRHHLKVIYDGAHAFGVKKNGECITKFADATVLSFHATKPFHSVEGGAVVCNNKALADKIRKIRNFGIESEDVEEIGLNAKMNEFQAAMGLCNLEHFDEIIAERKKIVERYIDKLSGMKGIVLNRVCTEVKSNYAYFPIRITHEFPKDRNSVHEYLMEQGIQTRKYFYPLTCDLKCYKTYDYERNVPIARKIANEILAIPLYQNLTEDDIDNIVYKLKQCK